MIEDKYLEFFLVPITVNILNIIQTHEQISML